MTSLLDRALADKAASRHAALSKAWPEKVAVIARLRDTARLAKQGMAQAKRKAAE